jgi:hypothetical protein
MLIKSHLKCFSKNSSHKIQALISAVLRSFWYFFSSRHWWLLWFIHFSEVEIRWLASSRLQCEMFLCNLLWLRRCRSRCHFTCELDGVEEIVHKLCHFLSAGNFWSRKFALKFTLHN